jgi:hypothetical protein
VRHLLGLVAAQIPVGAATLVFNQRYTGVIELQGLQHQSAGQQVRQHHSDVQPRQLDHVAAASPGWIADDQVLHIDAGRRGEHMYPQVSDRHGPLRGDVQSRDSTARAPGSSP